jgi:hypothetical protein
MAISSKRSLLANVFISKTYEIFLDDIDTLCIIKKRRYIDPNTKLIKIKRLYRT